MKENGNLSLCCSDRGLHGPAAGRSVKAGVTGVGRSHQVQHGEIRPGLHDVWMLLRPGWPGLAQRQGGLVSEAPAAPGSTRLPPITPSSCVLPQRPPFLSINAPRVLGGGQEGGGVDQRKGDLVQNRPRRKFLPPSRALTTRSDGPGPGVKIAVARFQPQGCSYPPTAVSASARLESKH